MKDLMEESFVCENGVPLYVMRNPDIGSFSVSVYLRHGAMYDPKGEEGFSHLFEHAVFANIDALMDGKLDETADLHGLTFNGSTRYDYIEFVISGASAHFELAAKIISLVFAPFVLSKEKLLTESRRVKAEIAEEDPNSLIDVAYGAIFGGTPLSEPITGKRSGIDRYGVRMLRRKRPEMLSDGNVFVYAGGNVPDGGERLLVSLIGKYPRHTGFRLCDGILPLPEKFGKRDCAVTVESGDGTSVLVAFDLETGGFSIPEINCFIDCFDYASPIYTELSLRRGLIYSFECDTNMYGSFAAPSVSYSVRSDKLYESLEALFAVFAEAKNSLGKRLPFVYPLYIDNIYACTDLGTEISGYLGYANHILGCGHKTISERLLAYSSVTGERMEEMARRIFVPERLSVIIKGNKKRIDVTKIKSIAYSAFPAF